MTDDGNDADHDHGDDEHAHGDDDHDLGDDEHAHEDDEYDAGHAHGDDEHAHGDDGHDHAGGHHHHDLDHMGVAVVTVSSSRTLDDDPAGDAVAAAFERDGHEVVTRELVRDDFDGVQSRLDTLVDRDDTDVVVTTGGTGVTPDDVTVEAATPLFDKRLPGFGELFRQLSSEEVGTRVVGTRAVAGVANGVVVFCLPGSENAARLGSEELIVPEAPHLAGLARRD